MVITLIFFVVLAFMLIYQTRKFTYAESIVLGYSLLFVVAFLFTELLSAVDLLTALWVRIVWSLAVLIGLFFAVKTKAYVLKVINLKPSANYIIVVIIAVTTLLIATISPITNADSLTYHLSRVMYWIQHENINQFATNNHRQVSYQPLAEYLIVHIKLLGGSDSFANLVQWGCFVGCLLNGYSISKVLNLSAKQRSFVVFLIATIPMAILESSSTQNDLIAAFFVSLFFVGFLKYKKEQNLEAVLFLVAGVALGGLVKGTVYIFILPFCLNLVFFFFANTFWKKRRLQFHILILVGGFLLINGAYFTRNYILFDNIFGTSSLEISNEIYGIRPFISNIVRQFTLQLGIWTPNNSWNDFLMNSVEAIHHVIGWNTTDPRTTFGEYDIKRFSLSEDYAANTFHFILLVIATGVSLFTQKQKGTRFYWLLIWSGLFIFVVLIKWQIFANRLLLPWFVISMPLIVKSINLSKRASNLLIAFFTLMSLPFLFLNSTRPLISYNFILDKVQTYVEPQIAKNKMLDLYRKGSILFMKPTDFYAGQPELEAIISVAESLDESVQAIGLDVHRDFEDYLLLARVVPRGVVVKHLKTEKPFGRLEDFSFSPEVVISTRTGLPVVIYHGMAYSLQDSFGRLKVYRKIDTSNQ